MNQIYLLQFLKIERLIDIHVLRYIIIICQHELIDERAKFGLAQGDHNICSPNDQLRSSSFSLLPDWSQISLIWMEVKFQSDEVCVYQRYLPH